MSKSNVEGLVVLPKGILSFPALDRPKEFDGEKNFSTTILWTPASFVEAQKAAFNAMLKVMDQVCRQRFGKGLKEMYKSNPKFHIPIRDGMEKPDLEGFGEGVKFTSARSKYRPRVLYPDTSVVDLTDENAVSENIYGGRHAIVVVNVFAFDVKMKSGISFGLDTVQLADRGKSFEVSTGRGAGLLAAIEIEELDTDSGSDSGSESGGDDPTNALDDDVEDIDLGF